MPDDRPLLYDVDRFLRHTAMPPSRFGRLAARDPRLVRDLRNGRAPGKRLRRQIEHFMNIYQYGQQESRS